jgi:hypothetical protein
MPVPYDQASLTALYFLSQAQLTGVHNRALPIGRASLLLLSFFVLLVNLLISRAL